MVKVTMPGDLLPQVGRWVRAFPWCLSDGPDFVETVYFRLDRGLMQTCTVAVPQQLLVDRQGEAEREIAGVLQREEAEFETEFRGFAAVRARARETGSVIPMPSRVPGCPRDNSDSLDDYPKGAA